MTSTKKSILAELLSKTSVRDAAMFSIIKAIHESLQTLLKEIHPSKIEDIQHYLNIIDKRLDEVAESRNWVVLLSLLPAARVYIVEIARRVDWNKYKDPVKSLNQHISRKVLRFPHKTNHSIRVDLETLSGFQVKAIFHESAPISKIIDSIWDDVQAKQIDKNKVTLPEIKDAVMDALGFTLPYPAFEVPDFNRPLDIEGYDFTKDEDFAAYEGKAPLKLKEGDCFCLKCYMENQEVQEDTIEALEAQIRRYKSQNNKILKEIETLP